MKPIDPDVAIKVGVLAEAIGSAMFEERLLKFIEELIGSDFITMTRYSRFSKPEYVTHSGCYSAEHVDRYLSEYYRFDPFYRYWRQTEAPGPVWLQELLTDELLQSSYFLEHLADSNTQDELCVFLPPMGRASVALFLERQNSDFSVTDKQLLLDIFPIISGLYKAHINSLFGISSATKKVAAIAMSRDCPILVTDATGNEVYLNEQWQGLTEVELECLANAMQRCVDTQIEHVVLENHQVLHHEYLDDDFRLAPKGHFWSIEQPAKAPTGDQHRPSTDLFDDTLTAREKDIVTLILRGYPTSVIADKLNLSVGTVKNHRGRIYYKLDITTERELFLLYIDTLS